MSDHYILRPSPRGLVPDRSPVLSFGNPTPELLTFSGCDY